MDSNSQVETLKEALDKETQLTTQLKTALDAKQNHIKKIEGSSLEANNSLEERIKKNEEYILNLKQEKISLERGLDFAKQLNTQINDTKEQAQNNLQTISLQNKKQATRINDLEIIQHNLEQKVNSLELKLKDLKEREKLYLEAEELYEQNFQDIADKTYNTTQFLEELRNSSDLNKSLHQD